MSCVGRVHSIQIHINVGSASSLLTQAAFSDPNRPWFLPHAVSTKTKADATGNIHFTHICVLLLQNMGFVMFPRRVGGIEKKFLLICVACLPRAVHLGPELDIVLVSTEQYPVNPERLSCRFRGGDPTQIQKQDSIKRYP